MPSMMMPSMAEICGATQEKIQGCHRASAEKAMMMTPMKRVSATLSLRKTDSMRPPPLRHDEPCILADSGRQIKPFIRPREQTKSPAGDVEKRTPLTHP